MGQYSVVEAEIEESQISGIGDHSTPRLMMPFYLNIAHGYMKPDEGIKFRHLRVKLCVGPGRVIGEASDELNQLIVQKYNATRISAYLEFPLNQIQLAALESLRAGGNLKLRVEAKLFTDHLWAINPQRTIQQPPLWAYLETWESQLQEDFIIPRDIWISQVLPRVGYGVVQILELPVVPIEACQRFQHSFEALRQAQERHRLGQYDDAVGKCRVALDPFFKTVEKQDGKGITRRVQELPRSWQSKLGEPTYNWLNGAFGAIREAGNPTHHSPNAHYDQMESQMILGITAGILAFVAKIIEADGKT